MTSKKFDADLLIVGMGPAGDVLAGLARLAGISVIAIEKSPAPYPLPRAAVFDHEIMRVFQALGVAKTILPLCRILEDYQFLTADGQVLLHFDIDPHHPVSAWAETYVLHQPAVEAALRDRLIELGVDMRLGASLTALSQDANGVTATVTDAGGETTIRARYAAGCDGASSQVRELLGIPLFDYGFDEPWLVLDTILESGELPVVTQQICDPKRPVTHLGMSGKRFRWEFMLKPGESPEDMLQDSKIHELLAPWDCAHRVKIERKAVYRFHALLAEQWRVGRVLLAGDAAHQMPPFAGQGMCAGIRDAANLAWKLKLALEQDDDAILDSYQVERAPHVREIIETAIAMGRVVCLQDEQAAAQRNAGMLARKAAGEKDISLGYPPLKAGILAKTQDAGAQFPQFTASAQKLDDALEFPCLISLAPLGSIHPGLQSLMITDARLAAFGPALQHWLAERNAGAVLIRPDRYVFGVGDAADLQAEWLTQTGQKTLALAEAFA